MSRSLDERLRALGEAADLADGRLEPEHVAGARAVVRRAGARLGLGVEATVVALAGPTGAGKSTLFNALAGSDLVAAGRRRPTTSTSTAAVWGDVPDALLDWLEVPLRHRVGDGPDPHVVLDLPDFDSVERRHRSEVDRLLEVVDLLVWVVDPQKYADRTLHEDYLRALTRHGDRMLLVLNHADLLRDGDRRAMREDLRGLLARDGLDGVPVLVASAATGEGVEDLRAAVRERVRSREAAVARLAADVGQAADALGAACAGAKPTGVRDADRDRLVAALADAAGVPAVVGAVARAHRRRGALATGWPLVRWVRRLRPDPLGRLRLGSGGGDEDVRTSLPGPTPVQRAVVASASRSLAEAVAGGLPDPWPSLTRRAATAHEEELPGRLDRAVAGVKLPVSRPRWWALAGLLQRGLALAALAGLLWLVVLAALGWLRIEDAVPVPEVLDLPLPTLLLLGGLLLGLLLAVLFGRLNRFGAGRRARRARRDLHARVAAVAEEAVVAPVEEELGARERLCAAVAAARAP